MHAQQVAPSQEDVPACPPPRRARLEPALILSQSLLLFILDFVLQLLFPIHVQHKTQPTNRTKLVLFPPSSPQTRHRILTYWECGKKHTFKQR